MASFLREMAALARYRVGIAATRAKMTYDWLQSYNSQMGTASGASSPMINRQMQGLIEREDVNLATCVRIVADEMAWLPLLVMYEDTDSRGNRVLIPDNDHPFRQLWRNPHPQHTTSEITKHLVASLLTTGCGFLARSDRDDMPKRRSRRSIDATTQQLKPKPSWRMFIRSDEDKDRILGFTERLDLGRERNWDVENIVYARLYNINDPLYGRSGVEPLKRDFWTEYQAEMMLLAHFANDGTPRAIFSPAEGIDPVQQKQLEEYYRNRANPDDKNRLQIAPVPGEFHTIQPTMVEMEFQAMRRFHRERTYSLLGIPPGIGGVWEHAHYANAAVQESSYWRHTMIPLCYLLADVLTRHLLARIEPDPNYLLMHDLSGVEALRSDALKQARTAVTVSGGPVLTPNEARQQFYNLEPLEGGDELRKQVSTVPGTNNSGNGNDDGDGSAQADGQNAAEDDDSKSSPTLKQVSSLGIRVQDFTISKGMRRVTRQLTDRKVAIITRNSIGDVVQQTEVDDAIFQKARADIDARISKNENRIAKPMKAFFADQLERVLDALDRVTVEGAYMTGLYAVVGKAGKIDPNNLENFLDMAAEKELLAKLFEPIILELVEEFGAEEVANAIAAGGIGVEFDVRNPKLQAAVQNRINKITGTAETTFRDIRRILMAGYTNSLAVDEVAQMIRDKFAEYRISRSLLIARTEMTGISNTASRMAWNQAGATHKIWVATQDSLTRDYHVQYNGERVKIDGYFVNGPEPMFEPGDAKATLASNVCNCRCTMIYDFNPVDYMNETLAAADQLTE